MKKRRNFTLPEPERNRIGTVNLSNLMMCSTVVIYHKWTWNHGGRAAITEPFCGVYFSAANAEIIKKQLVKLRVNILRRALCLTNKILHHTRSRGLQPHRWVRAWNSNSGDSSYLMDRITWIIFASLGICIFEKPINIVQHKLMLLAVSAPVPLTG